MRESEELKSSRAAYLKNLTKYGAVQMPATAHYTAGYKDGSAILQDVANLCEEAERRLIETTKQRDDLIAALENCRLFAARHRKEDWALLILGFCSEGGVVGSVTR